MKKTLIKINTITAGMAVIVLAFTTSCSKDEDTVRGSDNGPAQVHAIKDKDTQDQIDRIGKEITKVGIYNETMDKFIVIDPNNSKDFSFSDPNPGWNFSNSSQVEFVPAPQGGGILFIGPGSFGENAGGTVVAGNSSVNINYTFCFSASDEAIGFDFGAGGPELDGLSVVIGIGGDFEALTTGEFEEEDDIFDFFTGIAVYIVYDNEASGNYPILNWFEDLTEDPDDLQDNGFAYVFAFQEPAGIYFSQSGSLNVSGGEISFDGVYWGITGNIFDWFDTEDEFEYVEVDGFGTMGCN